MKIIWTIFAVALLAGCQKTISYKKIDGTEFVQVENGRFDRMVISDKARFSKYDKIVFSQLTFDDFKVIRSGDATIDRTWTITAEDKAIYSNYFNDELVKVYAGNNAQGEFGLGSGFDGHTLRAEFRLVELKPYTAKHGRNVSGTISKQSTESFGTLYIQILLVDSVSNEFVAMVEDGKDLTTDRPVRPLVNRSNSALAWKRTLAGWLQDLKETATSLKEAETAGAGSSEV